MHIVNFFEHLVANTLPEKHIWCLQTDAPVHIVSYMVRAYHEAFNAVGMNTLDVRELDYHTVYKYISTAFLGSQYVYLLEGTFALDKRAFKRLCENVFPSHVYHSVILFSPYTEICTQQFSAETCVTVTCDKIDTSLFNRLYYVIFGGSFPSRYLEWIFSVRQTVCIAEAYLIMWYYHVLGKRFATWCSQWLTNILEPQYSLFHLSHYVFMGNKTQTWQYWSMLRDVYPPEFWIAFWIEQLWQAYTFLVLARQSTPAKARHNVSKLPFSFLNGVWRMYHGREICNAMRYLYEVDLHIKTGGHHDGIDVFLMHWLNNSFLGETFWSNNTARNNDSHSLLSR